MRAAIRAFAVLAENDAISHSLCSNSARSSIRETRCSNWLTAYMYESTVFWENPFASKYKEYEVISILLLFDSRVLVVQSTAFLLMQYPLSSHSGRYGKGQSAAKTVQKDTEGFA